MICEACGEKEAIYIVERANLYKGERFYRTDKICGSCLEVYFIWEKEGRFLNLKIKKLP